MTKQSSLVAGTLVSLAVLSAVPPAKVGPRPEPWAFIWTRQIIIADGMTAVLFDVENRSDDAVAVSEWSLQVAAAGLKLSSDSGEARVGGFRNLISRPVPGSDCKYLIRPKSSAGFWIVLVDLVGQRVSQGGREARYKYAIRDAELEYVVIGESGLQPSKSDVRRIVVSREGECAVVAGSR